MRSEDKALLLVAVLGCLTAAALLALGRRSVPSSAPTRTTKLFGMHPQEYQTWLTNVRQQLSGS